MGDPCGICWFLVPLQVDLWTACRSPLLCCLSSFHHANDYWSMSTGSCPVPAPPPGPPPTCAAGKSGLHGHCFPSSPNLKFDFTETPEACCSACSNTEGCAGWCWGKFRNDKGLHSCNLKKKMLPGEPGNCTASCASPNHGAFLSCVRGMPVVDLWQKAAGEAEGPSHGANGTCAKDSNPQGPQPPTCKPGPMDDHWWGGYEDSLFQQHALDVIRGHNASQPLFLFFAPHIVHQPLQVPQHFIDKFSMIAGNDKPQHSRQYYHAMVNFADEAVGNITDALKSKNMWGACSRA